jgi:site-specific recombinase XerD
VRSTISSQHHRPPNYLIPVSAQSPDLLILREWLLVLRGDGKSPRTIEGYADSVRLLASFLQEGGFPSLTAATAEHVREWFNALRRRGNKPATVNTRYRGVSAFYKWLRAEGEVRENPLERIEPPHVPETVQPYYTPEELQLVLKSLRSRRLRGLDAARTRAILLVLFDTGLRASELCALRLEDVNWDAQTIVVRETKGGNQRVVSLGTAAMRSLMSYLRLRQADSPWLFAALDGSRLTRNALKLALRRAFKSAGFEFKGIHAFRRASGIEYLRLGGQAEDLRVLMGWRSPEMIRRYVKAAEVQRAVAAHKRSSPADHLDV